MTAGTNSLILRSLSAVDADRGAAALVAALDEPRSLPAVQRLRAAAVELLAPRLGHQLLDVGCGTGDMARTLAAMVGPLGAVLGIDSSEAMLTEAASAPETGCGADALTCGRAGSGRNSAIPHSPPAGSNPSGVASESECAAPGYRIPGLFRVPDQT